MYIGTMNSGIYKTSNSGESWDLINEGLTPRNIRVIKIDPYDSDVLYAGTDNSGVWKSEDGGANWVHASIGLNPESRITSIEINPNNSSMIFVSDLFSGVYQSNNKGVSWEEFNHGLDMRAINEISISSDGLTIFAATEGKGVYKYELAPNKNKYPLAQENENHFTADKISIDGESNDWEGEDIFDLDTAGDSKDGYIDITSVYAFIENNALFFLVEVDDPNLKIGNFAIQLSSKSDKYQFVMRPWDLTSTIGVWKNGEENIENIGTNQYSYLTFYPAFEGKIDFRDLGSPNEINISSIYVSPVECCGTPYDSWVSSKDTPRK